VSTKVSLDNSTSNKSFTLIAQLTWKPLKVVKEISVNKNFVQVSNSMSQRAVNLQNSFLNFLPEPHYYVGSTSYFQTVAVLDEVCCKNYKQSAILLLDREIPKYAVGVVRG